MTDRCLRALTPNRPQRTLSHPRPRPSSKPLPPPKSLYLFQLMDIGQDGALDLNALRSLTSLLPLTDSEHVVKLLKRYIISARSFQISREKFVEIYENWTEQSYSQCQELNSVWRAQGQEEGSELGIR